MRSINDLAFRDVPEELALAKSDFQTSGPAYYHDYREPAQGAHVPKSWFVDPFSLLDSVGLGYKTNPSTISYGTLKAMAEQNVVIAAIILTRIGQVASFTVPQANRYSIGFKVSHKDKSRKLLKNDIIRAKDVEKFLLHTGVDKNPDRDNLKTYVKKVVRDRLTYDQVGTEIVGRNNGKPHSFYAVPSETLRLASPKQQRGTPLTAAESKRDVKYVQVVDGVITSQYTPYQLGFGIANPRTSLTAYGYGYSELEMLIRTVTAHLWAEEWNRKAFSQGSTTKGILNIKGNIPPQQMDAFKRQWLVQVSGVANAWRTPVINSNEDIQWISLQPTNNDMGYQQWLEYLIKVSCAIYLMDPSEINFDVRGGLNQAPMFMTTNEAQQKVSQDRGLRPLLHFVADHINTHLVSRLDDEFEFEFVGIDAKTEEQAIELRLKELQSFKTLNEVREHEQLPPVPHGDIVPNPSYIGYRNQKEMMEQQQQAMPGAEGSIGLPEAPPGVEGGMSKDERGVAKDAIHTATNGKKESEKKKSPHRKLLDRFHPQPSEDWELTYRGVQDSDLKKALEPFDDLIG